MAKYVFSSTVKTAEWDNTTVISGDAIAEDARLKDTTNGDLLIWGHTRLAEALMRHGLVDLIDLSIRCWPGGVLALRVDRPGFWRTH